MNANFWKEKLQIEGIRTACRTVIRDGCLTAKNQRRETAPFLRNSPMHAWD
jgi:hypothetical protein